MLPKRLTESQGLLECVCVTALSLRAYQVTEQPHTNICIVTDLMSYDYQFA